MAIVLVGGGSRSGKSRFALERARCEGERLAFVATAQAFDPEMEQRIGKHRAERGEGFFTIEAPFDVAGALKADYDAIVVDCLTLWVSNLMLAERPIPTEELIAAARKSAALVIFVTNEVGCGIVPENELARRFRDEAGWVNQAVAAAADEVYWMAFGIPLRVKP
jgi:adenosylcobinamide kinase/adenosylcobinamide-phosphate guanylyltransferase